MRDGVASVVARVSSRRSSSAVIVVAIGGARENENSRERERKNVSRRKRKVTANADRKKSFLQSPIPDPRNAGGTSRASQRLGGPPMTGVGHVPPLEAGELRRAAGRVEVIDAGLHQRVPGGRAREPQRGVGVLVPSHRATRFRCASGNGKAHSRGCVFPLRRWTRRRRRASSFRNASSEGDALHVVLRGRYARARGGGGRRRGARRAMRKWTRAFPSRFVSRAVVARSETNFFGHFSNGHFY